MVLDSQLTFLALALPALFGMTLLGEGVYKMSHFESGWLNFFMGIAFLGMVAFGYFYLYGWM